ncbi:MAG: hypothetical protein BSOLF_1718 [Candidatus Carbobacillus altaicus]|uniref:Uncharacterized protein n=1 Tax=Candidatus Carbonibacillus altaicus TaxID=2163959 RepID=A0A2R6XZ57_9BACL|nr:MAG: hypothetical protein BSOLF_1718 [Candidatus Carbobacillus altaicus]
MIHQDDLRKMIGYVEDMRIKFYQALSFQNAIDGVTSFGRVEPAATAKFIEDLEGYMIVYPSFPPMLKDINRKTINDYKYYYYNATKQAIDWENAPKIRLPASVWIVYTLSEDLYFDLDNFFRKVLINAVVRSGLIPDDSINYLKSITDVIFKNTSYERKTYLFLFPTDNFPSFDQIKRYVSCGLRS